MIQMFMSGEKSDIGQSFKPYSSHNEKYSRATIANFETKFQIFTDHYNQADICENNL